ncbi:ligand-binding sensor domain-containing protein [Larkinella terrae]|uniref:Regulator n=1 Tax=Larkinella terrae TaxID=2025311 RepID=A0A7K0EJH3_9BACT|nr:regulator [Larkinella terrae]MRS61989.1 regulator [Larkinella terrae]
MNRSRTVSGIAVFLLVALIGSCRPDPQVEEDAVYQDAPFWQEYHEAYPISSNPDENQVRSVAVDSKGTVWAATASGIFRKKDGQRNWESVMAEADKGPAFAVETGWDSAVWLGTWNGVYRFKNDRLERMTGPAAPVSAFCVAPEGVYALGPKGSWLHTASGWQAKNYPIARSIRDVVSDQKGGIWVATDVGLFHSQPDSTEHFYKTDHLISAYSKGIAFDADQKLWVGGLGGVTVLNQRKKEKTLRPENGIPSNFVTCVEMAPDSSMWVGSEVGVVRYRPDGSHSLRFSRRWLLDDHVSDIAFDADGNAWIATPKGVSAIKKRKMTLAQKHDYFYDVLMKRHIRAPWIAGQCKLTTPGDTTTFLPEDDDNDGEYTGNYLAMECFRYAATKNPDAKEKAAKAFRFLKLLQEVTDTDGFFARTIVPARWTAVHDGNRTFSEREKADELVKEPRFKPVEIRWRKSKDGQWLWKGDTSSDELCGHMIGYYLYYELVADAAEKTVVRQHIARIVDYLMKHNFNLVDVDGKPTRWAVWSPEYLNHDPEWTPDRSQNSMEMLAFLKLAQHVTGQEKYEKEYRRLIDKEHYLDNMAQIPQQNPAWFIYFDVMLQAYVYPILIRCEKDPKRVAFYEKHMDEWMERRRNDRNPLVNFFYCYARNKKTDLAASMEFLVDTPLDLVNWTVDHTKREDVRITRDPVLDELQVNELPPSSIRTVVRWDKNPWAAINGDPGIEREPVFWLLPYWMGRYLKMIE